MPDNNAQPSDLLECKLGEPLMHGPRPYEWCVTHQRLMMTCRASAPASTLLTEEQLAEIQRDYDNSAGSKTLAGLLRQNCGDLLAHIRELQQRLKQTISDDCETDTRCRELLKQWDKSDSYGVEPLEVVIERALKALPGEAVESFRSRLLEKVKAHLESLPYEPYAYAVQGQILDLVEHFPVEP